MSLEELGNLQVTSVSKRPEKLSEAAAAVFVITREDIRRSAATSLPEVLRLAPNLEVARISASGWAVTARGFNSHNGNKLLVLIDGRTVYSPLYSGVWWDSQDVVMEDIDRIEVISGPGGTLWGSNAVNGVINIRTRRAAESSGALVSAMAGKDPKGMGAVRYGGDLPQGGAFRVYAKAFSHGDGEVQSGATVLDAWHMAQGGFRADWGTAGNALTVQGDAYHGVIDQGTQSPAVAEGGNLLGRWEKAWSADSALQIQVYADRVRRDYSNLFADHTDTLDLDVQHRFKVGSRQTMVWGGGYRSIDDRIENSRSIAFLPDHRRLGLANVFAQDSINLLPEGLDLTLGAKWEHNDYTGMEFQPNARLAWKPAEGQLVWASASRAVRTPSRLDRDYYVPGQAPFLLAGGSHFISEVVKVYEAGYKWQEASGYALSLATFYNDYKHLRSIEPNPAPGQGLYILANEMEGDAWGAEFWGEIPVTSAWHLRPGYAYLREGLRLTPQSRDPAGVSAEGNDPRHRFLLTSFLSLTSWLELDGTLRHTSALPNPATPAYTTMDVHLGWKPLAGLEVALLGQNLFAKNHVEFQSGSVGEVIQRQALLRVSWSF
jgi:iron complex outermembrane receptor protein